MKQEPWKKWLLRLLFITPLALGYAGLRMEGTPILDALFTGVQMYALEYGDGGTNLLIEIARWTAPLATASGVILALSALRSRFRAWYLYRKGCCTAVYGPEEEVADVLTQLGGKGIPGGEDFVRAQTYILLWDEGENLVFYGRNRDKLQGCTVYLKCTSLPAQATADPELRLFCWEETAVRLFWKRNPLYHISRAAGYKPDIVFIGFGLLGEELLLSALQNHIFHPDQCISYHIFGRDSGFTATHPGLQSITDPVRFYDTPWYDHLTLIENAAMVVVVEQEGQLALLQQLTLATIRQSFHVFANDPWGMDILEQKHRVHVFDWEAEAGNVANLFRDDRNELAKAINLRYAHLYGGVAETEENKQAEWEKLNAFTRYSNISSADYHEVQRAMLTADGVPTDYDSIPADWKERLSHLEHIRWCRYHYLHNWRQGIPENGKAKDPEQRIHADLIDYKDLTEGEKDKDRENIRILFSVERKERA